MLLTPLAAGLSPVLEQTLRTMFLGRDHALLIHIHTFSAERCLLSDRGLTSPVPQNPHLVFDFNLAAQAFIRYAFLDYDAALGRPLPTGIAHGLNLGPKLVQVFYPRDNFQSLDVFHRRAIEQSFNKVFCSGLSPPALRCSGSRPRAYSAGRQGQQDAYNADTFAHLDRVASAMRPTHGEEHRPRCGARIARGADFLETDESCDSHVPSSRRLGPV
jgi:hypothetical protein